MRFGWGASLSSHSITLSVDRRGRSLIAREECLSVFASILNNVVHSDPDRLTNASLISITVGHYRNPCGIMSVVKVWARQSDK